MHPDRTFDFATPAEQAAEREVQFDRLRINLHHFDEGFDGLVRLLVEEKIESLEIGQWQRTGFGQQLLDVHARRKPAQGKEQRKAQKPPELEFHVSDQIQNQYGHVSIESEGIFRRTRPAAQLLAQLQDLAPLPVNIGDTRDDARCHANGEEDQQYQRQRSLPVCAKIETHRYGIGILEHEADQQHEQQDAKNP